MIRLSRLTDYGIVLMSHFAKGGNEVVLTARELAEKSGIPRPTVSKVLKILAKGQLLDSTRGVNGGYSLAKRPEEITVAQMIDALEGPFSMTECTARGSVGCGIEHLCPTRGPWHKINHTVRGALGGLSLRNMVEGAM